MPSLPLPTSLTNHARWPSSEWTMTWYTYALSLHQIYFSRPPTKPTFALKIERALCLRLQSAFIPTICWPTYRDFICQTNCCRTFLLSYTLSVVLLIMLVFMLELCSVLKWCFVFFPKMLKYFAVFEVFFEENLPKLFQHFQNNSLTPDFYLIDW